MFQRAIVAAAVREGFRADQLEREVVAVGKRVTVGIVPLPVESEEFEVQGVRSGRVTGDHLRAPTLLPAGTRQTPVSRIGHRPDMVGA